MNRGVPVARNDRVARRPIHEGQVACPRRGTVDVVECFGCRFSDGLTTDHIERVMCRWSEAREGRAR
jgi:hypothetical protein